MSDEPPSPAAIRRARLKSALRDNLRRRKAQARDRSEGVAETAEAALRPPEDRDRDP